MLPPTSLSEQAAIDPPDHAIAEERAKDDGILGHCFRVVFAWSDLYSYIRELRTGLTEVPWSPSSSYTRIHATLVDCEARLSPEHLFKNVVFPRRSPAELFEHKEY